MTPLEKQQIWNVLYRCTRNGYPGATYETYDSPKDPRVRGGRYSWKSAQLRDIYEQLVRWGDLNQPTAAWRELLKYKTKIAPACLRNIFQSITFGPPLTPTYQINPAISPLLSEGDTLQLTVVTTNVPNGTVIYFNVVPYGLNPAAPDDFSGQGAPGMARRPRPGRDRTGRPLPHRPPDRGRRARGAGAQGRRRHRPPRPQGLSHAAKILHHPAAVGRGPHRSR